MQSRAAQGDKKASDSKKHVSEKAVEVVKVGRYWPGKAPSWQQQQQQDDLSSSRGHTFHEARGRDADGDDGNGDDRPPRAQRRAVGAVVLEVGTGTRGGPAVLEHGSNSAAVIETGTGAGRRPSRPVEDSDEEDDDAMEARRERLRALQRQRRAQAEAEEAEPSSRATVGRGDDGKQFSGSRAGPAAEDEAIEEEEEEEGESEYETDSEEDGAEEDSQRSRPMLKPVFVAASKRETVKEREILEAEELAIRERKAKRLEERKEESRALLIEAVRKEEEGTFDKAVEFADLPDDNDEVDELEEFDLWKLRELKRVRREREEAAADERERAEIERRRNLSDADRAAEDKEFNQGRAGFGEEKAKWKYLQKYYHKGAYFQDEDQTGNNRMGPVMMKDYGSATGNDTIGDKSALPAPMQVKNFGMRSQVKWTHLGAEDTLGSKGKAKAYGDEAAALWARDKQLAGRFERKQAGQKAANDFDRPSAKRSKQGDRRS